MDDVPVAPENIDKQALKQELETAGDLADIPLGCTLPGERSDKAMGAISVATGGALLPKSLVDR